MFYLPLFLFAGEASGTSGSKWHANNTLTVVFMFSLLLPSLFLASLFHVVNKTSVMIRPLTVTVNSDGVMHFSTVFYFINVSCDLRRKAF